MDRADTQSEELVADGRGRPANVFLGCIDDIDDMDHTALRHMRSCCLYRCDRMGLAQSCGEHGERLQASLTLGTG